MLSRTFFRSLATSVKSTKPPVQLFGIDGTYANALYSATIQQSDMNQTFNGLKKIQDLLSNDTALYKSLSNPGLTKDDRLAITSSISKSLNLDKTTANFLTTLAENNRLDKFPGIFNKFGLLNDAFNGVVEAKVTSAKPLDSKILKRLQNSIGKSSFVGEGKTLKLTNSVNPELLGGLVVEVGDRTLDVSIANKVSKLNKTLKENL
ncbi:unnamed protein product [Candida verbasci]|uniref:ATP synthase subunit 5, mitochondrial n=1 Tax=Candida verbasci TaxID=1227364 RepID=A0A9W4TWT0_9ASCO|nr:unnamed protein product [Candida verbasci]